MHLFSQSSAFRIFLSACTELLFFSIWVITLAEILPELDTCGEAAAFMQKDKPPHIQL